MPAVPPLALNSYRPDSSWLYEAYVIYDGTDAKLRESVDKIADNLLENGVRTMKNLNEPGSVRTGLALARSTTTEAIVSAGVTIIFVTPELLAKAAGLKGGKHESVALEVGIALQHAKKVVPVAMERGVRDHTDWPGEAGALLASHVGTKLLDLSGEESACETSEGADYAAWQIYYAVRAACGNVPTLGTPRMGDAAGTPRVADAGKLSRAHELHDVDDDAERAGGNEENDDGRQRAPLFTTKPTLVPTADRSQSPGSPHSPARRALRDKGRDFTPPKARGRANSGEWPAVGSRLIPLAPPATSSHASSAIANGLRPLDGLNVDECVQLFVQLGYGKYALALRMQNVDGQALCRATPESLTKLRVTDEKMQQRLLKLLKKHERRGVGREMIEGQALYSLWQALTGAFPEPTTVEDQLEKATARRKGAEAEALTPRAIAAERAKESNGGLQPWMLHLAAAGSLGSGSCGATAFGAAGYNGMASARAPMLAHEIETARELEKTRVEMLSARVRAAQEARALYGEGAADEELNEELTEDARVRRPDAPTTTNNNLLELH